MPISIKGYDNKKSPAGRGKSFVMLAVVLMLAAMGCLCIFLGYKAYGSKETIKKITNEMAGAEAANGAVMPPKALPAEVTAKLKKAQESLTKGQLKEAAELAYQVVASITDEDHPTWWEAAQLLSNANVALFLSDIPSAQKELYIVKRGDVLANIAKKYNTTAEVIQKNNRMEGRDFNIVPGQTLCVYKGYWKILVKKSKCRLYLYDGDKLFKVYMVGVGRQNRTPAGTFLISMKQKEPDWYYKGKKYEYGSKENILGTRWMAIKPTGETNPALQGYGIHGTAEPESVGKPTSNGCIRMVNEEVNELFSIVPEGTEVVIEE